MRSALVIMASAMVGLLMMPAPAHATRCLYPERSATGAFRSTMAAAQASAIGVWQSRVARKNGARFADWYYSGDRTITCRWNDNGTKFRCKAAAVPCGE
jgi:hypothetical protein